MKKLFREAFEITACASLSFWLGAGIGATWYATMDKKTNGKWSEFFRKMTK